MSERTKTEFPDRKILVIDDEQRLAQSLAALLKGTGYNVRAATGGPEGLELIRNDSYDLVITDLRMAGVDGFDIMQFISKNCPSTALIVITGHASTRSAIEALHQRAADYLTKPFDFDVLRNSIERVFAQQETERLRRDMVNMLTHDIKVPLTNILGFAKLLVQPDGTVHRNGAQFAGIISMNCQKLILMLDNYLTNARLEEGRLELSPTVVRPAEIVRESIDLLAHDFEKKGIVVEVDLPDPPIEVMADETLLGRAISNLLGNAAKYTPPGEMVRVELRQCDPELVIVVANTGTALDADEVTGIFERYRRARSSAGTDGTGLGLHIVRSIAEAHGGRAWCESAGNEVRFHIALPATPPHAAES